VEEAIALEAEEAIEAEAEVEETSIDSGVTPKIIMEEGLRKRVKDPHLEEAEIIIIPDHLLCVLTIDQLATSRLCGIYMKTRLFITSNYTVTITKTVHNIFISYNKVTTQG